MTSCEHFQVHLLDHLYDLLDPADAQALTEHLEQCPDCRSALAQAESQQQMFAAAARTEFPALRFEAPPAAPIARPQPAPAKAGPPSVR